MLGTKINCIQVLVAYTCHLEFCINECHIGYWSGVNEDWSTQQQQSILNGKEQPLSSSKWGDLLKGIKTSHHLKVHTKQTSYKIITDSFHT